MNKISNISFKLQHYYCDFLNLFWAIDIVDHKILLPTFYARYSDMRVNEMVCFSACFVRASGRVSWFYSHVCFFSQQQPFTFIGC